MISGGPFHPPVWCDAVRWEAAMCVCWFGFLFLEALYLLCASFSLCTDLNFFFPVVALSLFPCMFICHPFNLPCLLQLHSCITCLSLFPVILSSLNAFQGLLYFSVIPFTPALPSCTVFLSGPNPHCCFIHSFPTFLAFYPPSSADQTTESTLKTTFHLPCSFYFSSHHPKQILFPLS